MNAAHHKKESAYRSAASRRSDHIDRKRDSMILAGLAGLLAFIGVYAETGNAKIAFALASGVGAAAIVYFVAKTGLRRRA
jgi:hypothetical protein